MLKPKTKLGLAAALSVLCCVPAGANVRFAAGFNVGAAMRALGNKYKMKNFIGGAGQVQKLPDDIKESIKKGKNITYYGVSDPGGNPTKLDQAKVIGPDRNAPAADARPSASGVRAEESYASGSRPSADAPRPAGNAVAILAANTPAVNQLDSSPNGNAVQISGVNTTAQADTQLGNSYFGRVRQLFNTDALNKYYESLLADKYLADIDEYELETELTSWARALRLEANVLALWDIAKTPLSIGVVGRIGYSFQEYREKDNKDKGFKESRGFFASFGLVLGITQWIELQVGLGTARHKTEVDLSDWKSRYKATTQDFADIGAQLSSMSGVLNGAVKNAITAPAAKPAAEAWSKEFADFAHRLNAVDSLAEQFSSSSVTQWQLFLYGSIGLNIPIIADRMFLTASVAFERDIRTKSKDPLYKANGKDYQYDPTGKTPTALVLSFGVRALF